MLIPEAVKVCVCVLRGKENLKPLTLGCPCTPNYLLLHCSRSYICWVNCSFFPSLPAQFTVKRGKQPYVPKCPQPVRRPLGIN